METKRFAFENLEVWQKAVEFANRVINLSEEIKTDRKHYRLIEQLESASTSIALNIAEGKGRYFIDDDRKMAGKIINGYPILGDIENLPTLLETHHFSQIIVSSLKIPSAKIQAIKQFCEKNGVQLKRFTVGLEEI